MGPAGSVEEVGWLLPLAMTSMSETTFGECGMDERRLWCPPATDVVGVAVPERAGCGVETPDAEANGVEAAVA